MKAVILAGGFGTRLSEETQVRPKPMVEIGGKPILWHIMKGYLSHGVKDFIICLGYKGYLIKEYFANYVLHMSDVTFDMATNQMDIHSNTSEDWRITLVDTGENVLTGGRLKRVARYLDDQSFCLTYGDGVSDVNLTELIAFHKSCDTIGTVTGVQPPGRFGSLHVDENRVSGFEEKPQGEGGWINGGFFVFKPRILEYIEGDMSALENPGLTKLADDGQLSIFRHRGFWQPMDTLRDKNLLESLWFSRKAPWKTW